MATIRVKVRPSRIEGRAGTVYYQVTHRRVIRQITTDIHVMPADWDDKRQRLSPHGAEAGILQRRIDCGVSALQAIVTNLDASGTEYAADDVVRLFGSPDSSSVSVLSFMRGQVDYLYRCNRLGTAKNYERALHSFSLFLGGDIPFMAITEQLVEDYNASLLQHGIVRNSVSFYMRILRAVYNKAVRRHLAEPANPFQNVYTGVDKTRKRAIDERLVAQLYKLSLPRGSSLELSRDIFIFCYCMRGMAFVDAAYLKKTDIQDGFIRYVRRKTGQLLSVRIESDMRRIIGRYAPETEGSCYVFPILKSEEAKAAYRQYQSAINVYNRRLKKLAELLSCGLQADLLHRPPQLGDDSPPAQCSPVGHKCRIGAYLREDHANLSGCVGERRSGYGQSGNYLYTERVISMEEIYTRVRHKDMNINIAN